MPKVYFKNDDITVNVEPDITIMEAMRAAGMVPDAPCGGNGKCGKCKVYVNELSEYVLSCQSLVGEKDITVSTEEPAQNVVVLQDGLEKETSFNSHITRISLKVPPCPAGKSISDSHIVRYVRAFNKKKTACFVDKTHCLPLLFRKALLCCRMRFTRLRTC